MRRLNNTILIGDEKVELLRMRLTIEINFVGLREDKDARTVIKEDGGEG